MDGLWFYPFDPAVAAAYAVLVVILVVAFRRAESTRARLALYILSLILVTAFLLLFAPR